MTDSIRKNGISNILTTINITTKTLKLVTSSNKFSIQVDWKTLVQNILEMVYCFEHRIFKHSMYIDRKRKEILYHKFISSENMFTVFHDILQVDKSVQIKNEDIILLVDNENKINKLTQSSENRIFSTPKDLFEEMFLF